MRFTTWLVLIVTLVLWSGNWIVARAVRDDISPGLATFGRVLIVIALLLPFTWRGLAKKLPALTRRDWLVIALLGLTGGGPHLGFQWLGLHYTTATSGTLYLSTTPIFILLWGLLLGERIGARQAIGVAISLCGVAMIATQGNPHALTFNVGDLLAVMSMIMWSGYTVMLARRRDPLSVTELLTLICAFGAVFMVPWLIVESFTGMKMQLTGPGMLGVLYSAVGSLLLAFAGWSYVVTRLGPSRAGVTMHLMPAIGVVLSAIFLREYPFWFHFVGIALILAGVTLSSFRASSASRSR
ncbi:MAG TPA: DMT family transporter [Burkholderiales bacterium]|nr:DMT family transporter [Burkholderiales bacterium]